MMAGKPTLPKTRRQSPKKSAGKSQRDKIAAAIAELDQLKPKSAKAAKAIALFKSWLADESGYDEETWPKLKKALNQERDRVGARRLFND
jgi:hypothetical protein